MLSREQVTNGTHLVIDYIANEGVPSLESGIPVDRNKDVMSLFAGRVGHLDGREVKLVPGDIVVVEKKPREEDGVSLCRVRRAISQTIGEVHWSELQAAARLRDHARP
jgi:hypothetical protein